MNFNKFVVRIHPKNSITTLRACSSPPRSSPPLSSTRTFSRPSCLEPMVASHLQMPTNGDITLPHSLWQLKPVLGSLYIANRLYTMLHGIIMLFMPASSVISLGLHSAHSDGTPNCNGGHAIKKISECHRRPPTFVVGCLTPSFAARPTAQLSRRKPEKVTKQRQTLT